MAEEKSSKRIKFDITEPIDFTFLLNVDIKTQILEEGVRQPGQYEQELYPHCWLYASLNVLCRLIIIKYGLIVDFNSAILHLKSRNTPPNTGNLDKFCNWIRELDISTNEGVIRVTNITPESYYYQDKIHTKIVDALIANGLYSYIAHGGHALVAQADLGSKWLCENSWDKRPMVKIDKKLVAKISIITNLSVAKKSYDSNNSNPIFTPILPLQKHTLFDSNMKIKDFIEYYDSAFKERALIKHDRLFVKFNQEVQLLDRIDKLDPNVNVLDYF
jgi:hypothetical protein